MEVVVAKRIELEGRIEHEERKLNEIQDPTYSHDQRNMIENRIKKKVRDELNEIDIRCGASKQINQIRGPITKFLNKETGILGKRIRTLFKEQGIMIVSILTAAGMAIGFLIESLLSQLLIKQISRQSIGSPTRNHRFDTFMDFEQSKRSGWLIISEFVGTYNRCWSFDPHIRNDQNEKEINHLNIHNTVKIADILNIKATFSSS